MAGWVDWRPQGVVASRPATITALRPEVVHLGGRVERNTRIPSMSLMADLCWCCDLSRTCGPDGHRVSRGHRSVQRSGGARVAPNSSDPFGRRRCQVATDDSTLFDAMPEVAIHDERKYDETDPA